ncbi:hypothetical protein ACH4U7_24140 [Streptomyces sp. NPDC020845]|uniref:hypothetical protein n=1 Tax=Streptomyces sp. NPDC020845 TaxID=3365096 RepID=UPI003790C112
MGSPLWLASDFSANSEGELCAKVGPELADDCRSALDMAASMLPPGDEARDPDLLSIFLNGSHRRAGGVADGPVRKSS